MIVPVVLCINNGYTKQATVVMYSALSNACLDTKYQFFLLTHDLTLDNISFIKSKINGHKNLQSLEVRFISDSDFESIPLVGGFGKETNFRLFIPKYFPELDKAIYIDSDTMILGDLTEVFSTDIQDKCYAACSEKRLYMYFWNPAVNFIYHSKFKFFNKLGINILDENTHYTNAGVMLINVKYWIAHNYLNRALDFLTKFKDDPNFRCPDQETLNYLSIEDGSQSRVFLDWKYNVSCDFIVKDVDIENLMQQTHFRALFYDEVELKKVQPVVVHYAGVVRPWEGGKTLYAETYKMYASEIGWTFKQNFLQRTAYVVLKFIKTVVLFLTPHGIVEWCKKNILLLKKFTPKFIVKLIKKII
ncbi:MAG: glycosyltransferase family 8 protein [Clostridiales bacterium]|jgi:lipopolysaccharide biosynthesis glycosyltransferase|nr:glycosyltransferase family 8 protein [Clostridiales bacterium]